MEFQVTNPNEITKAEFDKLNKLKEFDIFSENQIVTAIQGIKSIMEKGERNELSQDEQDLIKSGTAEIENLTKYTVNEMKEGRIVKTDLYVQPKQVEWVDTLEKSMDGKNIMKGVYLDTELNRKLDRVGEEIIKGEKISFNKKDKKSNDDKKSKDNKMSDEEKDKMKNSEMYKAMCDMAKEKDMDKGKMMKAMSEKYPDADKKTMKRYMGQMYKAMKEEYMEKANSYAKMAEEEDEDED